MKIWIMRIKWNEIFHKSHCDYFLIYSLTTQELKSESVLKNGGTIIKVLSHTMSVWYKYGKKQMEQETSAGVGIN